VSSPPTANDLPYVIGASPVIAGLALMSNILGILIEYTEPDDVGGDILTTTLMVLTIAFHAYRLRRAPVP
jgi:hypothetical protein